MSTLELRAYEIFKNKFGEKEAEVVIEYFDAKAEEKFTQKKDVLLTKDDKIQFASKIEEEKDDLMAKIDGVKTRIEEVRDELNTKIDGVKTRIEEVRDELNTKIDGVKTRIEEVNSGLITRIETTKTEMVKWMFIFWIGTIGVLSGMMITLFNVYLHH